MKTKKKILRFLNTLTFLVVLLTILILLLLDTESKIIDSQIKKHHSYIIANEFRQTSDDLTDCVRLFAMTGDTIWENKYYRILNIRNGSYPRKDGKQISLVDSLKNLGVTKKEFDLLKSSDEYSTELVWTEKISFNAIKGNSASNISIAAIPNDEKKEYGRKILFDERYMFATQKILAPIDIFISSIEARNEEIVNRFIAQRKIILAISFILVATCVFILFSSIFILRRKKRSVLKSK
jgi:hypothetical protein